MIDLNGIKLNSPFILAPMAGYTDLPFRKICRDKGAALVITELISAEGIIRNNKKTLKLMEISDEERPVGIQIFGKEASIMAEAAVFIEKELKPDLIDINMGCCAPKVTSSGSGATLIKDPELAYKIAKRIKSSVKIPVTAKIRIGWDNKSKNYKEVVTALEESGISYIAVHGRTKAQKYEGYADWDIINEISNFCKIPVIGNGDVNSYDEAHKKLKETNCKAIMIGRAALGNPWIFSKQKPSFSEIITQMKDHLKMMIDYYGEYGLILSRKHLVKYIHDIRNAAHIRADLITAKSSDIIFKLLNSLEE